MEIFGDRPAMLPFGHVVDAFFLVNLEEVVKNTTYLKYIARSRNNQFTAPRNEPND